MIWAFRFLLATVLIAAGILKASEPVLVLEQAWVDAIPLYGMLMQLAPWIEIAVGLFLLSELPLRWTSIPVTLLYCVFVVIVAYRLISEGWSPDCGCFGAIVAPLDIWHMIGNAILAVIAVGLTVHAFRAAGRK